MDRHSRCGSASSIRRKHFLFLKHCEVSSYSMSLSCFCDRWYECVVVVFSFASFFFSSFFFIMLLKLLRFVFHNNEKPIYLKKDILNGIFLFLPALRWKVVLSIFFYTGSKNCNSMLLVFNWKIHFYQDDEFLTFSD